MTTENNDSPRDINVLLALDTYQGMTDEEIDMIIDYKVEVGVKSEVSRECINAQIDACNSLIAISAEAKNIAYEKLSKALNRNLMLERV